MAENCRSIRSQNNGIKDLLNNEGKSNNIRNIPEVTKPTSLSTLIIWNISKALEKNPTMEIKCAIKAAAARLACERDVSAMMSDSPEQRHLACAMLAWQQLGHSDADSLYQFIESNKEEECTAGLSSNITPAEVSVRSSQESKYSKGVHSMSFGSSSIGPVIKLPVETKIVMRMESSPGVRPSDKKSKAQENSTKNKIDAACCMDSACAKRLDKMGTATTELRTRAGMLARREAERVELLERAEVAWRDLELGYERRLTLAKEKEDDLTKQIQKIIEDRNGFRNACTCLATQLKTKGEKAEKDRAALSVIEKELCQRACQRLKLSEESTQGDAVLAEYQCRTAQLDRDLQFKEEQSRRMLLNFQSELESSQTITHETERAMRAELSALREQIAEVAEQLLQEDAVNATIKKELEDLNQEKMGMVEDLDGCKAMCDSRMQGKVEELKKKRDELEKLKDIVTECRCKKPVDKVVEVKRTASLAVLCQCKPEGNALKSCSCTSLGSQLLSNLLRDLFSGLQSEMGGTGTQMPCQLLKCLEDKHNWDRSSVVKTNLKNYFAQLLIGELDIAIATSIEKYHAKWVGQSCADTVIITSDPDGAENDGWQERLIECRAQTLANKLAEQLFLDRADELTQKAKEIISSGPPPCECKPQSGTGGTGAAVYPVLVTPMSPGRKNGPTIPANAPAYWRQAMHDVTQLRVQIEDLKKDSIRKEDLKLMEDKITKIVQFNSGPGKTDIQCDVCDYLNNDTIVKKEPKTNRATYSTQGNYLNVSKPIISKKKQIESNNINKKSQNSVSFHKGSDKTYKPYKKLEKTYAINMCMCSQKDPNKISIQNKIINESVIEEGKRGCNRKDKASKDLITPMPSSVKQTKPINSSLQSQDISTRSHSKSSELQQSCERNCKCFHKIPSNTSIDRLLETLTKWKSDLHPYEIEKECQKQIPSPNFVFTNEVSELNNKKKMQNDSKLDYEINGDDKKTSETVLDIKKGTFSTSKNSLQPSIRGVEEIQINLSTSCDKRNSIYKSNAKASNKEEYFRNINNSCNTSAKDNSNSYNKGNECYSSPVVSNKDTCAIAPSQSEYMGAINLDKSNEDFCKCANKTERRSDPTETFKCMPCKCSCKSLTTKNKEAETGIGTKVSINGQVPEKSSKNMANAVPFKITNHLQSKSGNKKLKKPEIFPCDCGYDIQFLGVTLTDMNAQNQMEASSDKEKALNEKCKMTSCNSAINKSLDSGCDLNNEHRDSINDRNNIKKLTVGEKYEIVNSDKNKEICYIKNTEVEPKVVLLDNKCEKYKKSDNESSKVSPSCECKVIFDEFKNYINVALQSQQTNEDKCLDIQSFKDSRHEDESCVCCDKQNLDDSYDLEENTFHLLEEHLKKKLEEFKETSSTCIPTEEKEKLFTTILQRVKEVITESTNKIACKCSNEVENSQGSWNRAYGLLQEYLKTKIKRVQCSCIVGEGNSDTILPDVLDKVCNLIEYDFERLKDVCGCKKSELQVKDSKQVYFKDEVPERDNDILKIKTDVDNKTVNHYCSQTSAIIKENISSQVPIYFGMETKSCNPLETFTKNVHTLKMTQESLKSLDTIKPDIIYGEKKVESEILVPKSSSSKSNVSKVQLAQFSNISFIGYASACICKDTECYNFIPVPNGNKTTIVNDVLEKPISNINRSETVPMITDTKPIRNSNIEAAKEALLNQNKEQDKKLLYCSKVNTKDGIEFFGVNETNLSHISDPMKNDCTCNPTNSSSDCQRNYLTKTLNKKNVNFPIMPYIGYTLDCSCDTALGACVCTKSIFQADNTAMDSMIKESMPNEKYYEKKSYSYIMNSNPNVTTDNFHSDLYSEMTGDLYLHNVLKHKTLSEEDSKLDCETEISFRDEEDIFLKCSREFFDRAHTTTNTFDDDISINTDYSNTEAPLDWCECSSLSDQHKRSISFPEVIKFGNNLENDIKKENVESEANSLPKSCDCDMVPICHVRMLVENIENKLVSAKCTCDSMIPKVCPIHSTRC